jgi:hypothetical protein
MIAYADSTDSLGSTCWDTCNYEPLGDDEDSPPWPGEDLWQTVDRRIWKEYIKALWKEVLWYPDNIKSVLYPKVQLYCRRLLLSISGWVAKKGQRKKN